jgi:glycosyltransferase involved in cell wall biosynthesis
MELLAARPGHVMEPLVSVVMAVRNGEAWLGPSIGSILAQSYRRLELIVVDDGSTDRSGEIAAGTGDPRVIVLTGPARGLTPSLNRAIERSRGALIARMDADDVARPERIARQVELLAARPDVGLVGTGCVETAATGEVVRIIRPPEDDEAIRRRLIRANPFVHASVVMRRSALERVGGGYDESFPVAQDYDLWLRLCAVTRLANLAGPLLVRHLVPGRVTAVRDGDRLRAEARARWRAVRRGTYPPWCAVHAVRPALALAIPGRLRRLLRGRRGG